MIRATERIVDGNLIKKSVFDIYISTVILIRKVKQKKGYQILSNLTKSDANLFNGQNQL